MPLEIWPYCIFAITFVLGGFFAQSRTALLSLLLVLFTLVLSWFGFHRFNQTRLDAAVLSASICVPVFTILFHYLRERGLWSMYGALRLAGVVLGFFALFVFSEAIMAGGAATPRQSIWLRQVAVWLPLPLLGMVTFVGALGALQFRRPAESPMLGKFLSAMLIAVFAGLCFRAFIRQPPVAYGLLFGAMILAGLFLIGAVLESAWRHAFIDELTELPGRRAMKHHCARLGSDYMIAVIDIDHFKSVNDNYGHKTGDHVLRFLASQLRTNSVGRAYRLGGEEFVIIAEHLALADAVTALNKLRAKIADRPFGVRDLLSRPVHTVKKGKLRATVPTRAGIIPITVSIGIAHSIPDHPATPEDILATADKALYQAKEDGRNLVRAARDG